MSNNTDKKTPANSPDSISKQVQSNDAPGGRHQTAGLPNPLEPLLPRLMERLRAIRREMQEGANAKRMEAGGRGSEVER